LQGGSFRGSHRIFSDPEAIVRSLLNWHEAHKRDFSFRRATDPYAVLVAEIMLRQTTARQVDKIWPKFMRRFPDPKSLVEADIREVEQLIAPLGIRSRARQLKEIARIIVERWQGRIPADPAGLMELPGVGEYIANCVVSFCYGVRLPLIDSNVRRVLMRVLGPTLAGLGRKEVSEALKRAYLELASVTDPRHLHYALLDLAALVCKAEKPLCDNCPISLCPQCKRQEGTFK